MADVCISLPGTVVAVRGPAALIETAGTSRWCNGLLEPGLEPGDRVLVHAGLVVQLLSPEQAGEIEDAFAELASLDAATRVAAPGPLAGLTGTNDSRRPNTPPGILKERRVTTRLMSEGGGGQ